MMMPNEPQRQGKDRERNLERDAYYSDEYFQLQQLCAQAHQVRDIHRLKPQNIIEIGIGNGFTSTFLRQAGYPVTTVDINPQLKPDICTPLDTLLPKLNRQRFDLLVCCEVLEHLPFDGFENIIESFTHISDRLYLTLPNYHRSYGFGGFIRLPMKKREFSFHLDVPFPKKMDRQHFWELNGSKSTRKSNIVKTIQQYYPKVNVKRLDLCPYHFAFTAHK